MRRSLFILWLALLIIDGQVDEPCPLLLKTEWLTNGQCYSIGRSCLFRVIEEKYPSNSYQIDLQSKKKNSSLILSNEYSYQIHPDYLHEQIILFSLRSATNDRRHLPIDHCQTKIHRQLTRRHLLLRQSRRSGSSSTIITFNSSSFIDFRQEDFLDYPLRLSVRFRTIGRVSTGVLLSFAYHKSNTSTIPFIIIEHSQSKIEITILQLDERDSLSTVTTVPCGKNVNNDQWHWLQFEIDQHGIFTIVVDDDSRTSQIPSYVVSSWKINALLIGDTRRLTADLFQPFLGYMADLVFNDEHLFTRLTREKDPIKSHSSLRPLSQHILLGYRIAFFNLLTIETQSSYIAFSERESQTRHTGKFDIYFLFRTHVPDGIILYRYAQGLNEYFAVGLRAGILTLLIDFGFGKRQILSDESMKLADGKWHEVRVTRLGLDKIELAVDNRVNRSILSSNGIRNAVALQPVLYVGGIPSNNPINFTSSTLNALGFQGCLASFLVDGRALDYQRALVVHGQMKLNVCSDRTGGMNPDDLNKLCYDFTCIHSGICTSNEHQGIQCDCTETGYIGERCDKFPMGFYFGKHHGYAALEYPIIGRRATEQDTIIFGLQTLSNSAQIFRLESDSNRSSLEYEIVRGRSYIKLNLGERYAELYSGVAHVTDGFYHVIKVQRRTNSIQLFVDGIRIELDGGHKFTEESSARSLPLLPRRLHLGNFHNGSHWNGIIAGLSYNRQLVFDHFSSTLIRSGDLEEVYPDEYTGHFKLIEAIYTPSPSTTLLPPSLPSSTTIVTTTTSSSTVTIVVAKTLPTRSKVMRWFDQRLQRLSSRSFILSAVIAISFLLFLLFILLRLHCTQRERERKASSTNGKNYSQLNQSSQRYSLAPSSDGRLSKKRVPKLLRYLHTNEAKPTSFRLNSHRTDSYQLISPLQDQKSLPYRNSDCVLNEHCCIHSSLSQPIPSSSSSIYHQVNRLMLSGSDPPLPLPHHSSSPTTNPRASQTLRSMKKEMDNASAQTYSAVYSCDLASNFDLDQESMQKRLAVKRRSILKNTHSTVLQTKFLFLYSKTSVDAYALQKKRRTHLLAIAEENRLQFFHALSGSFHSQLTIPSVGSCHNLFFSSNGEYLIGLFYEVTANVNPYSVKICSTEDFTLRPNPHPIKCSIALPSQCHSTVYMAGKQKYGRGISLGLLDLETLTLVRELKSDPDTSIGDEIRRIVLSDNERYALVACTEHNSRFTCFVIFQLDSSIESNSKNLTNCTMILTRFDSDPNQTFALLDQRMLTVLRTNEILIWQLTDGEILFSYEFSQHNADGKLEQILQCELHENRLLILMESACVHVFQMNDVLDQRSYLTTITDPLISSVHWLDHRHLLTLDHDGERFRMWNVERDEMINQSYSHQGAIDKFHLHAMINEQQRTEYLLLGSSQHERTLFLFEYTPSM